MLNNNAFAERLFFIRHNVVTIRT